ncbi:YheC/YheD family protein [Paenibacillus sp. HB172176]|uniref:YheC/YheD family protein n=1 Tax=Paenibacillus sp. HB172176 TaxID=2493690 RepID=UPI00143B3790|nr:YheC/YheD family protein [Paenibacillus sp. HB172176]
MSAKKYASSTIRGKLRVCSYLKANRRLKPHVPHTKGFNRMNLEQMLGQHGSLYVKPDIGSLGIGIMNVKKTSEGYELKEITGKRQRVSSFRTASSLYESMLGKQKGKLIIQQAITLDLVNGRPYDIRVMVQRRPGGKWTCTGFLVKVGAANKIVTNYYQGGDIYTLHKLNEKLGLSSDESARRKADFTNLALEIARTLSKRKSGMREMGVDFAYSKSDRIWVLEVNSNHPQFHPLKKLDSAAYKKMKSFAASYGRTDAK